MFNGIIENQAKFVEFNKNYLILNFFDLTETQLLKIKLGDSIACNGTCLTVTKIDGNKLSFDLAPETILKTNLSKLQTNDILNIEFPMRIGDKINGHLVYGHIYGLGKIISVTQDNIVTIETEKSVFQYLDYKAPVTINGIALTISDIFVDKLRFSVNIIPFTWSHTNLKFAKVDDLVNIEPDILAVYSIGITKRDAKNSS
jgi:riboflavin synthase